MIEAVQSLECNLERVHSLEGNIGIGTKNVYPALIDLEVTPSSEVQTFNHEGSYGYDKVIVNKIEDDNLIAENIKSGVDILGVKGKFVGSKYAPKYVSFRDSTERDLSNETSNLDTSNITDMSYMFYNCKYLNNIDFSNWDTSKVTNMSSMFYNCNSFGVNRILDFSNWDTSKVTNMSSMFQSCIGITSLDLSSFDTSNVTNMAKMFRNCTLLTTLDIRKFDFSNCTSYVNMFYGVKTHCLIIVKSQAEKDFVLNERSDLTKVKTVAEYEAEE